MMTFLTRRKPFFLAILIATACIRSWADAGHDHGAAPTATVGLAKPRFTATSETFELVGVLNGKQLTLYLDRATDNSPVKGAQLELELGGTQLDVKPHGDGEFEATLAAELQPGAISVTATVIAGPETDLLAGELDMREGTHADASVTWTKYGTWFVAGLLALAVLAWGLRRQRTHRINRVGGAA